MTTRIAYFDCLSGVSGDMTLGALVGAGWPVSSLAALPARLRLDGVEVQVTDVRRGPFAARRVEVRAPERQPHRHLHHIVSILDAAELPEAVRDRSKRVFRRLAEAEADVHGTSVEKVHFHEVGAVDAIVDIVGALLGLSELGVGQVYSSELPLGGGTVRCEHGLVPVPAPATVRLLEGVPVRHGPVEAELVTPTGAALLAELVVAWGSPPPYRLIASGIGAGAREFPDHPNVLRVILGEGAAHGAGGRTIAVLETAMDDESPQRLADLSARLLAAGALDAMLVPTLMKKGRPGHLLVVVTLPEEAERLGELVLQHSTSLGVRIRHERRLELPRRIERVATRWGEVELKVASLPDGSERAHPEFESVARVAALAGRSLHEVGEEALAAWRAGR